MAARAIWKGALKVGEVSCAVSLYTAVSTSDRIAFHTINRATGHRVRRLFVDSATGDTVAAEDQAKGYLLGDNDHIVLDPEEIAAAVPESDKLLAVSGFLPCDQVDDLFFDRPYYLAPASKADEEAYVLIREGMRARKVAAMAQTVLFRRVRTVLIRPDGSGMVATTLNFDYEVRSDEDAFRDIPDLKLEGEMLELAEHIIGKKSGKFDIAAFDDRYEEALVELVKAKVEGKTIKPRKEAPVTRSTDLLAALRESAGVAAKPRRKPAAKPKPAERKAG